MQRTLGFEKTTLDRFLEFHRVHPEVFELFHEAALRVVAAGKRRISARLIAERIRWTFEIERGDDGFKLNNNYIPYYARLVMILDFKCEGLFERRDAKFDCDDATLVREFHNVNSRLPGLAGRSEP